MITIIKERKANFIEVFHNLKNGGLKLLCENHSNKTISEVAWCGDNKIEIITVKHGKIYGQYMEEFMPTSPNDLKLNYPNFFNSNMTWYIGHIED